MKRPKTGWPVPVRPDGTVRLVVGKWWVRMDPDDAVETCLTALFDFYGELNSRPRHGRLMR